MTIPRTRARRTKIVATIGPASESPEMLRALHEAGVDVFRLNFSHGAHENHGKVVDAIRALETEVGRPIGIFADLQGPKLRVGKFAEGSIKLEKGQKLRLDLDPTPGDTTRVQLPHPDIMVALKEGALVLLDDGKVRLRVTASHADHLETVVEAGQKLSDRKGFNIPNVVLPVSALTEKDRADMRYALDKGVDWIALSFVQRPEDVAEARRLIGGRAQLIVKLEKPSAIEHLDALIDVSDALMLARGDLGVELPPEQVPPLQKRVCRDVRADGKPIIVATQMLESMVNSPTPTRAEASDVATAIYDGADAIMLSAETAAGLYPLEAVSIMDRIARQVEADPIYRTMMDAEHPDPERTSQDAITLAARQVAETLQAAAIVTYTTSGSTTLRAARERPSMPILCLTSKPETARRLCLSYGVESQLTDDIASYEEMLEKAVHFSTSNGIARSGQRLVITAGVPFGTPGNTNSLRIAWVD